jgi:hypothetical protein
MTRRIQAVSPPVQARIRSSRRRNWSLDRADPSYSKRYRCSAVQPVVGGGTSLALPITRASP